MTKLEYLLRRLEELNLPHNLKEQFINILKNIADKNYKWPNDINENTKEFKEWMESLNDVEHE